MLRCAGLPTPTVGPCLPNRHAAVVLMRGVAIDIRHTQRLAADLQRTASSDAVAAADTALSQKRYKIKKVKILVIARLK